MSTECKYGLKFTDMDSAQIERYMLQNGGKWRGQNGEIIGNGLLFHFKEYWKRLWPEHEQNRWTDLIMEEVLKNQFTSVTGCASSWKTSTISRLALMDWSLFPECTTVIMSSTTMEGLRQRAYAEVIMLWKLAKERYDWFPGYVVDHKCVITNENIEVDKARDWRNSVCGVPCKTSTGRFIGMSAYAGRKNRRVWCIGEEFQFMERAILDAQDNLISNGPNLLPGKIYAPDDPEHGKPQRGYKCVFIGNPNPSRPDNPLHLVSEPEGGWGLMPEDGKTKVWDCRKLVDHPVKCRCINLDSLDSPNNDYPTPRWPHLAGKHTLASYTEGSESYWSQGRGVFKFGLAEFKIITRELCEQFHAFDQVQWAGTGLTRIGACDAAYGVVGGDRCPVGWMEFGKCVDGKYRILLRDVWLCPVTIRKDMIPEDQIAEFTKEKMESVGVSPENFFFDGRGSLAMSFARLWSPQVNAIEFGGRPTERPVNDSYMQTAHGRRLKMAYEAYSKFVSELWWSWRCVIESDQMRGLTLDVVLDAAPREWRKVAGDKIEIESKRDMKKRTGVSPDLADFCVAALEGARRRGFVISKLGNATVTSKNLDWLRDLSEKRHKIRTHGNLTYA